MARKGAPPHKPEQDYANIIQLGLGMTGKKLARIPAERAFGIMTPLEDWSGEIFPRQWGMKSHGIPIMFGPTRMQKRLALPSRTVARSGENPIPLIIRRLGNRAFGPRDADIILRKTYNELGSPTGNDRGLPLGNVGLIFAPVVAKRAA